MRFYAEGKNAVSRSIAAIAVLGQTVARNLPVALSAAAATARPAWLTA
jgi:hypothetical protein